MRWKENNLESDDDLLLTEWVEKFNMAENFIQPYIEVDDSLARKALLTDAEILDSVRETGTTIREWRRWHG